MLITRTSIHSNQIRTLDIPCTQDQLDQYNIGVPIQVAMPNLTDDQREFIMTGITSDEWDELFSEEADYDY